MTDLPLISVVIPSFNHGHLIGRALESVFSQSYRNFEVLVVDNHSTDNTDAVLLSYSSPCLKVLKVHNGGSIAFSRNRGIASSRGEWIAFLDSDDWWTPDKLQKCCQHFHCADLIYHRLTLSSSSSRRLLPARLSSWCLKRPIFINLLTGGNPIATSSVLLRRSIINQIHGFDERTELIAAEDYDAWIRCSLITDRFIFVSDFLGSYYYSPTSASRKDMSLPMRNVYANFSNRISPQDSLRMDSNAAYAAGVFAFHANRLRAALVELRLSLLFGRLELKLKSLFLLFIILLRYPLSSFGFVRDR